MNPLHVNCWDVYQWCMRNVWCRVALDIGANDGGYTKTLLENGFEVHAFEPVPDMFAKMKAAHGGNPKAHLVNWGLSDAQGILYGVTVLDIWSIARPGEFGMGQNANYSDKTFDMKLMTVDDYLSGDPVGLIKLDVDGYEPKVLRGAKDTIKKHRPPIMCELSTYIEKMGTTAEGFCHQIFDMGYRIMSMDGKYEATQWSQVEPYWPKPSGDVMLIPNEMQVTL